MKTYLRQFTVLLLTLFLCLPAVISVHADEESTEDSYVTEEKSVETISARFYELTTQSNHSLQVDFNPDWFQQDATVFSQKLAQLSLGLAVSAFRPNSRVLDDISSMDENLYSFLQQAHFHDLRSDDYDKNPSKYTVSTVMGHQTIGTGDDAFELIAVGVCGQGYLDEWESNLTIGSGDIHEGFARSAQLVYDRIFGYIAANQIKGPCKVWISGFSRAAAVSNVTAAMLVDSDTFAQETVFAYTFATPRTVKDESPSFKEYSNIFNIVGKKDPVPSIPFQEWGYNRFGITYFLPTPESDSDYDQKREKADVIYKDITGIDFWYNQEADRVVQMILAYLLEICPTPEKYEKCLQDKLIHIWEHKDALYVIQMLFEISEDPELINEKTSYGANQMMNYLMLQILDFMNNRYFFRSWNNQASAGGNLLQAHTPELYVSWLFSTDNPSDLYNYNTLYSQFYIDCGGTVELIKNGKVLESLEPSVIYTGDEKKTLIPAEKRITPESYRYLSYNESSILATIPRDEDYTLYIHKLENVLTMAIRTDFEADYQLPVYASMYINDDESSDGIYFYIDKEGSIRYDNGKHSVEQQELLKDNLTASLLGMVSRESVLEISWKNYILTALAAVLLVLSLMLFALVYLIGRCRFVWKVRQGWIRKGTKFNALPTLCTVAIFWLFLIMQVYRQLFPNSYNLVYQFKLIIGALALGICFRGYLKRKDHYTLWTMVAMSVFCLADLVITKYPLDGGILYCLGYGTLTYLFIKENGFGKWQIMVWLLASAIALFIIFNHADAMGNMVWPFAAFLLVVLLMVTASLRMRRRTLVATVLLMFGGLLFIYNYINGETFLRHILSLGTYYAAIALLASSCTQLVLPKLVPLEIQNELQ